MEKVPNLVHGLGYPSLRWEEIFCIRELAISIRHLLWQPSKEHNVHTQERP